MRFRSVFALVVVLILVAVAPGCAKKEEPKPVAPPAPAASAVEEGKVLFEQKCSVCHGLDRATARTETKEEWLTIIREMQGRKADWISDDEAAKILEYLSVQHGK